MMAVVVATTVDRNVTTTVAAGLVEPAAIRAAMMLVGTKVIQHVLRARNVHMAEVASSGFGFNCCNCCIALRPNGVAALPNPNILADKFNKTEPAAGSETGMVGKRNTKTGLHS